MFFTSDISLDFSPLVVCILRKCLRLVDSDSGTFKLCEKAMISMYICNTLSLLLQTQVCIPYLFSFVGAALMT